MDLADVEAALAEAWQAQDERQFTGRITALRAQVRAALGKPWPEEEPNRLPQTEHCRRCGGTYWQTVWWADDALWERLHGAYGLLCPPCFSALAEEQGLLLIWRPTVDTS